jgi:hypothetical protein
MTSPRAGRESPPQMLKGVARLRLNVVAHVDGLVTVIAIVRR